MARMRERKNAICPLCHDRHDIHGAYWLIPARVSWDAHGQVQEWAGYQSEFWCDAEMVPVVKQYDDKYKYIGYYIALEIPF